MIGAKTPKIKNNSGFTLLEMLIALGLFSVVLTAASDIFMMANRTQRKTLNMERIQADARYAAEAMVREIRGGAIDYPWYEANQPIPETGHTEALAIVDGQGDRIRFFKSQDPEECVSSESESCLLVEINGGGAHVLTPRGVNVYRASFYIRPVADPYLFDSTTGMYGADAQPRVTISLVVESTSLDPRDRSIIYLQTTVGTRNFRR